MNKVEYQLLNRLLLIGILALLSYILIRSVYDPIGCIYMDERGHPCPSCGITRDFRNFIVMDFGSPINRASKGFFFFFVSQIGYRAYMSLPYSSATTSQEEKSMTRTAIFDLGVSLFSAMAVLLLLLS